MKLFLRNFVIPFAFVFGFAVMGFKIIGSDQFQVVVTADGVPVEGVLTEEKAATMVEEGVEIDSHVVVMGTRLPGDSRGWQLGILLVFCVVGYRIGMAFKIQR